jgi:hypothetical protein
MSGTIVGQKSLKLLAVFNLSLSNILQHLFLWGMLLVAQLVEALRYKPEGRGIDFRWCHWIFSLT